VRENEVIMFEESNYSPLPFSPRAKAMRRQCKLLSRQPSFGTCPCIAPVDCQCPEAFAGWQRVGNNSELQTKKFSDFGSYPDA
jgi:hypothetical protein